MSSYVDSRFVDVTVTPARHLYVHVPFCTRRCTYCDFAIAVRRVVPVDDYIRAVGTELEICTRSEEVGPLESIYLGGGTPSKLGPDGVSRLLDRVRGVAGVELVSEAELTIEANPEDVTFDAARAWRAAGATRLSVGVQSFGGPALAWMHRTHNGEGARRAMDAARAAGFTNVSVDLIFALPPDIERDWESDLEEALSMGPDHLSLYGLTVEPHSSLGKWRARGELREAPEELYAEEFLFAQKTLVSAGFEHYEVSNFARAGRRSRHNSAYWERVPYLGIGPSAHSFDGVTRRWNEREYERWKHRVQGGEWPVAGSEQLSRGNELAEVVYLALRTTVGLATLPTDRTMVDQWVAERWAHVRGGRIQLTAEGWLRLDSLAAALTDLRSR